MAYVMTADKFVTTAKKIATDYKTLYVMGCFGAPMTDSNKKRYTTNCAYNKKPARTAMINAASSDTFGFDCVNLIKGILWGWSGDRSAIYGGAKYASNGVPDVNADQIMNYCTGVSENFSNIQAGEIVHLTGHVGIYVGNGLVVECTPAWNNDVQFSALGNIGTKAGYHTRTWKNHGKLKFLDFSSVNPDPIPEPVKGDKYMFEVSTVEKGTKGADTLLCQKLLKIDGYKGSNGKVLSLDGDCGDNTVYAIRSFQKSVGIGTDGICGQKTWKALLGV